MKEHVLKYFELIFLDIKFTESTFENKLTQRQEAVQHLSKQDRFIYVKEGNRLMKPFQSDIMMRVLSILFVGLKPRFPHVVQKLKEITLPMSALACMWVSFIIWQ